MIRVLLVDDQELIRAGLRGILRDRFGFEIVGECMDGSRVVAAVRETKPDVVLMDVRMPGVDGIEATRRIVRDASAPRRSRRTTASQAASSWAAGAGLRRPATR